MATTATDAVTVRAITREDAAAVALLSGQLGYETTEKEMRQRIEALPSDHLALVACLNTEIVGWIEAEIAHHLQSPPHALITGLVVKDGVRSLGIGRRLCSEVERWTLQQGLDTVRVTSRSTRERAHRFYLREGYVQTKTSAVFEKILSPDSA
ncbi:MAG TPA: GNAT family N-acetyltransferase [Edaphobacter sp.]